MRSGASIVREPSIQPAFDEALLEALEDDVGSGEVDRLLALYESDLVRQLGLLSVHRSASEQQGVHRILHAMAGTSGAIGAIALAGLCRGLMRQYPVAPAALAEVEALALATLAALGHRRHALFGAVR